MNPLGTDPQRSSGLMPPLDAQPMRFRQESPVPSNACTRHQTDGHDAADFRADHCPVSGVPGSNDSCPGVLSSVAETSTAEKASMVSAGAVLAGRFSLRR
jgi:hypothetical protein